jgi:NAD-dependent deacetylase
VLYGDGIPRLHDALEMVEGPGALLVVGTSFYTSTASYVVDHARRCGRKIWLVNRDAQEEVPRILAGM